MNRDHSVVFEIASKYYISDPFVDHDGYSIPSKGFLPAVVDIFSKTSLNIWKFTVHVLPKPGLENFEHYFTSV